MNNVQYYDVDCIDSTVVNRLVDNDKLFVLRLKGASNEDDEDNSEILEKPNDGNRIGGRISNNSGLRN